MEISSKALETMSCHIKEAIETFHVHKDFYLVNEATDTLVRFAFSPREVIIYGNYEDAISDCSEGQSVKTWEGLNLLQKITIINQVSNY